MAIKIQLRPNQLQDWDQIIAISQDDIAACAAAILSADTGIFTPSQLELHFRKLIGARNQAAVIPLVRQILALHRLVGQSGISIEDVFVNLRQCFESNKWTDDQLTKWDSMSESLRQLLRSRIVGVVTKASRLIYEYALLYQDGRILTDVRPIFNDDATSLAGGVISFQLTIDYEGRGGKDSISLALDQADVESLLTTCQRALKKADFLKELVQKGLKIDTIVSGEQNKKLK